MAPVKPRKVRPHIAERRALTNALHRCHNPQSSAFGNYGGRGVKVCDEWRCRTTGFTKFFAHIGPRPSPLHSLDRINNSGNYEPSNVRWTDRTTQQNNRRKSRPSHNPQDFGWGIGRTKPAKANTRGHGARSSPLIPLGNDIKTLAEWAKLLKIKPATIRSRLQQGATPEQALNPSTSKVGLKMRAPDGIYLNSTTIH